VVSIKSPSMPMFRFRKSKEMRLSRRQCIHLLLYTLGIALVSVTVHEVAHIGAALAFGVQLSELKLGFMGMNPSVTLPEWLASTPLTVVHYIGGLAAGAALLLLYSVRLVWEYHHKPSFFSWSLGMITITLAAEQLATGYLEGRYHGAYIVGAASLFSPTNLLTYGWMVSAVFFHLSLCRWDKMRKRPEGDAQKT